MKILLRLGGLSLPSHVQKGVLRGNISTKYACLRHIQIKGAGFRPWISIQNMLFGVLIRGYFQQQFNLKEFMQFCPYALLSVLDKLETKKFDELSELVEYDCQKSILENWENLSPADMVELQQSKADDFFFFHPTLGMKVDVKQGTELQAFLAINIKMMRLGHFKDFFLETSEQLISKKTDSKKKFDIALGKFEIPTVHYFSFVREMTRGVDGVWKMVECTDWPKNS